MVSLAALLLLGGVGTAQAVDLDGRKAVGYSESVGGPSGLAFGFSTGYLLIEGIFGLQYTSFPKVGDTEPDPDIRLHASVGAHYQALQAPKAALTIGGRVNFGTGTLQAEENNNVKQTEVTQLGVDVPVRVYWFPNKHVSLHAEMAVAFLIGPEDGVLYGGDEGLVADGFQVRVFDGISALGLTFWW
jgi:hypothetical protein